MQIEIAGAPEALPPSNVDAQYAFYPNVAENTDLIVTPTPTGVEMMTSVRSAEAPRSTSYQLSLPSGATLKSDGHGGAEVLQDGSTIMMVPPPTAIDAAGDPVPVEMEIEDEALRVVASPAADAAYPILVDPNFIVESWYWSSNHDSLAAWSGSTTQWSYCPVPYTLWDPAHYPGLGLTAGCDSQPVPSTTHADWSYWVPRYASDIANYGDPPHTWLYQLYAQGVLSIQYGSMKNYPALVIGLIDPTIGWHHTAVHYGGEGEMTNWSNSVTLTNPQTQPNDKGADMNLVTYKTNRSRRAAMPSLARPPSWWSTKTLRSSGSLRRRSTG